MNFLKNKNLYQFTCISISLRNMCAQKAKHDMRKIIEEKCKNVLYKMNYFNKHKTMVSSYSIISQDELLNRSYDNSGLKYYLGHKKTNEIMEMADNELNKLGIQYHEVYVNDHYWGPDICVRSSLRPQ